MLADPCFNRNPFQFSLLNNSVSSVYGFCTSSETFTHLKPKRVEKVPTLHLNRFRKSYACENSKGSYVSV